MKHSHTTLAAALLTGLTGVAHAAGFALIEQNASGLGNAYAGAAAVAEDASTIFFNPAGMTMLPDRQLVVAAHLIKPKAEFTGTARFIVPDAAIVGSQGGDAGGLAVVPNFYYAFRVTPSVHFGLGLNAPFGLKTEYDADWVGRYQAIKSEVQTLNINPSLAFKIADDVSLGIGLNVQRIEATLTNRIPVFGQPIVKIEGDDFGWGYNFGLLWQAMPGTRIGLSYRSEVDYKLRGNSSTADPIVAPLNGPVTAKVTVPDSGSLSLSHKLSPKWDLLADLTWTGWSDFDDLPIVGTVTKTTIENWDSNMRYSLGATYHIDDRLRLRLGVAYDETPVSDVYRTPRIPDNSRTWLALGGQYRLSKQGSVDFGYAHLFVNDADLASVDNNTRLTGSYDNAVDILSIQYTHTF